MGFVSGPSDPSWMTSPHVNENWSLFHNAVTGRYMRCYFLNQRIVFALSLPAYCSALLQCIRVCSSNSCRKEWIGNIVLSWLQSWDILKSQDCLILDLAVCTAEQRFFQHRKQPFGVLEYGGSIPEEAFQSQITAMPCHWVKSVRMEISHTFDQCRVYLSRAGRLNYIYPTCPANPYTLWVFQYGKDFASRFQYKRITV